jgi:antitoxin HicB
MPHYIALIHKQADSCYGVSFPDVPGVTTAGDTIDDAMQKAGEVLDFRGEGLAGSHRRHFSQATHHRRVAK